MSTERRSCKRPALAATFSSLVGPPQQCSEDAVSKNTSSTADAASQLTIVAASSQYQGPGTTLPTEIDSPSQLFAAASLPESDAARGPSWPGPRQDGQLASCADQTRVSAAAAHKKLRGVAGDVAAPSRESLSGSDGAAASLPWSDAARGSSWQGGQVTSNMQSRASANPAARGGWATCPATGQRICYHGPPTPKRVAVGSA
eukprot:s935_g11.t1